MQSNNVPAAPLPPKAIKFGEYQPLDFQHQLLYKAQQLRSNSIPVAPLPPAPMNVHRRHAMLNDWDLKNMLELAAIRRQTRSIPRAPPAPAPASLDSSMMLKKTLKDQLESAPMKLLTRNQRSAVPIAVQEDAVRAAKDMRKALAEHNPPLAPAAPAPLHSAAEPLRQPIGEEAAKAATEMTLAHYPPLAPAAPAPDMIAKDAVSKKSLQVKLLPAAIHTMQNVEHQPMIVPDAPRAPSPYVAKRGLTLSMPLKDQLATAMQRKAADSTARSMESSTVPPPLPPRPAESLAAIAAMHQPSLFMVAPTAAVTATPLISVTPVMPTFGAEGMLDSEERMSLEAVAPISPGEKEIVLDGLTRKEKKSHKKAAELSPNTAHKSDGAAAASLAPKSPSSASRGRRGSIGRKIKGAMKEVQGTITRNPAMKEEGKMLLHGVDPATTTAGAASSSSASTTSHI
jgi:hypothetical protein